MLAGAYYGVNEIPVNWRDCLDVDVLRECRDQALKLLAQGRQQYPIKEK
jgi:ADP-ribosylglycohydrolase